MTPSQEHAASAGGSAGRELMGYADRLSVRAGGQIRFMVSSDYPAFDASIHRLWHADSRPAGPGLKSQPVDGLKTTRHVGCKQSTRIGSYAVVPSAPALAVDSFTLQAWICPTAPGAGRLQGLLGQWASGRGYRLVIEPEGDLGLHVGSSVPDDEPTVSVRTRAPLRRGHWYFVAASYDAETGRVAVQQHPQATVLLDESVVVDQQVRPRRLDTADAPLAMAAASLRPDLAEYEASGHYDGKIDNPRLFAPALSQDQVEQLRVGEPPESVAPGALLGAWGFEVRPSTSRIHDHGPFGLNGSVVNTPTRAVTSHSWTGRELDHKVAPEQYAAIHFHSDDIADAGWDESFSVTIPPDVHSGVYAARLEAGETTDHVPFVVRPATGEPTADVVVLMPTMTYLAYANERVARWVQEAGFAADLEFDPRDAYLAEHPEFGLSTYDVHSDGSGVCHSSFLRPIPNMRPDYRWWNTGGPAHFAADLFVIDWLNHTDTRCDVITDHDLHADGIDLIHPYKVLLTATHPEYWTAAMLDAVEVFLSAGGRVMYLGGNGFYTVTGVHPEHPHVIEIRRANGTRTWANPPGEDYLSTTGEPGGQWRYRGRAPNRLVGVGFTAQDNSLSPAAGYHRLPGSFDDRASFIFEGVDENEIIGDFGLMNGGAGGYELDRLDYELGTPPQALLLATTAGRHADGYLLAIDEFLTTEPDLSGSSHPKVRADMVYLELPNEGAVFSVGSINWCGSLSHDGYDNNVARITGNVLRTFTATDKSQPAIPAMNGDST